VAESTGTDVPTLARFDLSGRRAVVTGGGGFLGAEFALALAECGAEVHLVDLDEGALEPAVGRLRGAGTTAVGHRCDLTDETAVDALVTGVAAGGPVDVLVNSAAIDPKFEPGLDGRPGHLTGYPLDAWRRSLEVNLTGTFLATRACCRVMEGQGERGRGVIVNVSSTYGLTGPDQRIYRREGEEAQFFKPVDYATTKAGLLGFTRAVATLYRDTEIRCNALTPGGAYRHHDDEFVAAYSARTVLGRMARPDDYRGAIAFLCSDASAYMTGANLVVDGGWTAL
jgi:NAD(P)-dependent dehydrogenase (short-subunit alcohol dehydrogenase family)